MEIRPVLPEDDRMAISRVYEESWRYAYRGLVPQAYLDALPKGRWAGLPDLEGLRSLVLLDRGAIAGTACCCPSRWEQWKDHGEVVSLYLLPEYMGRGYGRALLTAAMDDLRAAGYRSILLWVLEGNRAARGFYEHMGFCPTGQVLTEEVGGAPLRSLLYLRQTIPEEGETL